MHLPLRRQPKLLVPALVAVAVLLAPALTSTASARVRQATATPDCGTTILKSDGTPWVCTFDDDFSGTALDPTHWTAIASSATGYTSGIDCYLPRQVTVTGGEMVLTTNRLISPQPCVGTSINSQYITGMVTSNGLFSQTYGRFEMRARLPWGSGLHPVFWMLPQNPNQPSGYEYGEIDVEEAYGATPNYVSSYLHYVVTPGTAASGKTCYVRNTKFVDHTYTLEWNASQMTFSYDGTPCWSTTWAPAYPYAPQGATSPVPFNQPFFMMVQLAVDGPNVPFDAVSPQTYLPAKMYVDYVKAWQ